MSVENDKWVWLLFPPAVDLANTRIITAAGPVDLLAREEDLAGWVDAERGRIPKVEAAGSRFDQVRKLRDDVYDLLHARARNEILPEGPRRRINAAAAAAPMRAKLTAEGRAVEEAEADDDYASFAGVVARSAIEIAGADEDLLSVCGAPSCGMLFLPEHPRQVWCSQPCGNRARVARHAARRRQAARR